MTETPDLLALRDGLPEGPWESRKVSAGYWSHEVRHKHGQLCLFATERTARAIAAIPSMLEEIEKTRHQRAILATGIADLTAENEGLRALVENKNEACLLAIADVERLHGIITELREALAAMLDIYDHPHVAWQKQRVASARVALIGREIEDNEAFWEAARAILAKTETTP